MKTLNEEIIEAACKGAGWDYVKDHHVIAQWIGARSGIVHLPTLLGRDHENDSVYGTFADCAAEALPPSAFISERYTADALAEMHTATNNARR